MINTNLKTVNTQKVLGLSMLIIVFVILISCSKNTRTDWEKFELKGNVKSFTEYHYDTKLEGGEWVQDELSNFGSHTNFFDRDGNYTNREVFNVDNKLTEKISVKKEHGKLVEEIIYNAADEVLGKMVIHTDTNDELVYSTFDKDDALTMKGRMQYKNNRLERQDIQFFENLGETRKIVTFFEYNEKGNVSKHIQLSERGDTTHILKYKYVKFDKYDNWTERFEYPRTVITRTYEYYEN